MLDQEQNYAEKVNGVLNQEPQPSTAFHQEQPLYTERQGRYVELERKLAAIDQLIKPLRDECEAAFEEVINESGIRTIGKVFYFQDRFGVVHKIAPREWQSVRVRPFEIAHTRRPEFGEARGSLAEKEAREQGYMPVINKTEDLGS